MSCTFHAPIPIRRINLDLVIFCSTFDDITTSWESTELKENAYFLETNKNVTMIQKTEYNQDSLVIAKVTKLVTQ